MLDKKKPLFVPEALKSLDAWLLYKIEHEDKGDKKPRKVPYYVTGSKRRGTSGSHQDINSLATYDSAVNAFNKGGYDGLMIATNKQFNITVLDYDNCNVESVKKMYPETYVEVSPSGKGVHVYYTGYLKGQRGEKTKQAGYEVFSDVNQVTFTGNGEPKEIVPIPPKVIASYNHHFNTKKEFNSTIPAGLTESELVNEILPHFDPDMGYGQWAGVLAGINFELGQDGLQYALDWSRNGKSFVSDKDVIETYLSFKNDTDNPITGFHLREWRDIEVNKKKKSNVIDFKSGEDLSNEPKPNKFKIESAFDFSNGPAPTWFIKKVLAEAGLLVIYGESGAGKSFVALDMVMHLITGMDWRGHKTKQSKVLYVCAEGTSGFRLRLQAVAQHYDLDLNEFQESLGIITAPPNILNATDCEDLVSAIKGWGEPDILVLDTFAQCMAGNNENDFKDMSQAVANIRAIHEELDCSVCLVHHTGKDKARGGRGHSSLKAATDSELEIKREGDYREIDTSKQKDGEDGLKFAFELKQIQLGFDEDGDEITSCVCEPTAIQHDINEPAKRKMGENQTLVLKWLKSNLTSCDGLSKDYVVSEVVQTLGEWTGKGKDRRHSNISRALLSLVDRDDCAYYIEKGMVFEYFDRK